MSVVSAVKKITSSPAMPQQVRTIGAGGPTATSTDPNVGIRKYLNDTYGKKYGISNSDIGFNNGTVQIKGKDLMKPSYLENGSSYAPQGLIDAAIKSYYPDQTQVPVSNTTPVPTAPPTTPTTPTIPSTWVDPNKAENDTLYADAQKIPTATYDYNTDPVFQALKTKYQNEGQLAYENSLGSRGDTINTAIASAASQAKNKYNEDLMALVPQMAENFRKEQIDNRNMAGEDYTRGIARSALAYTQNQDTTNRSDKQLSALGEVIDPTTGKVVNTATQTQTLEDRAIAKHDKEIAEYANNVTQFANQPGGYQAEIDRVKNDGDPSNDWMIPIAQRARNAKIDANLQSDIKTIDQYSEQPGGFMAEIQRRQATPDTSDDALIPYLYARRTEKLNTQKEQAIANEDKNIKNNQWGAEFGETVRSNKAGEAIQQQNANTAYYSAINGGNGSGVSAKQATQTTEGYKNIFAKANGIDPVTKKSTWESAANDIIFNPDAENAFGSNYDTMIKTANDAYYNQVNDGWTDREALKKELTDTSDMGNGMKYSEYYRKMLGDKHYNDLTNEG